jgi:hypothetical protein
MTDEHPAPTCSDSEESVEHRCETTSVPMTSNKAASKRADPPSVVQRVMERAQAKKAKATKAKVGEKHVVDRATASSSPPTKKSKLAPSKASGSANRKADVHSAKSDTPCVETPAKAVSSPTPTLTTAQDTSVSAANVESDDGDEECVAPKSTSQSRTTDVEIDSDAVDYGCSDDDTQGNQQSDEVIESPKSRTISIDSYKDNPKQGTHNKAQPASVESYSKRLPSPPASPRTARSDNGSSDEMEEGEEYDVTVPPPIVDFRKRNQPNERGVRPLGDTVSPPKTSAPDQFIHNGEPDSDEEVQVHGRRYVSSANPPRPVTSVRPTAPPSDVAVHARLPPVEQWPVGITPQNLLWKAVVRPGEFYDTFARMKRLARTMGTPTPMFPIPIVLHKGETFEQYSLALMSRLKELSADPTRQRNQWCSFAVRRIQQHYPQCMRPYRRYASPPRQSS